MRFPFITGAFILNMTPVGNNILLNIESFILRIVLNLRCNFNFLFFIYQFIIFKNDADFMTIMMYSVVDLCVFLFDFINLLFYFIFCSSKVKGDYSTLSIKN